MFWTQTFYQCRWAFFISSFLLLLGCGKETVRSEPTQIYRPLFAKIDFSKFSTESDLAVGYWWPQKSDFDVLRKSSKLSQSESFSNWLNESVASIVKSGLNLQKLNAKRIIEKKKYEKSYHELNCECALFGDCEETIDECYEIEEGFSNLEYILLTKQLQVLDVMTASCEPMKRMNGNWIYTPSTELEREYEAVARIDLSKKSVSLPLWGISGGEFISYKDSDFSKFEITRSGSGEILEMELTEKDSSGPTGNTLRFELNISTYLGRLKLFGDLERKSSKGEVLRKGQAIFEFPSSVSE